MFALARRTRRRLLRRFAVVGVTLGFAAAAGAATAPTPALVRTGTAGSITYASAALTGSVGPSGEATTYFFQYGTTTKYGSQTQPAAVPAATRAAAVTAQVAGLNPLTKYHFRLVGIQPTGTAVAGDVTFTTAPSSLSVQFAAVPTPAVFGAPVSVIGSVNGVGGGGRVVVLQQNAYPFTGGFQTVGNPQVTSPTGAFQFNLTSLAATTQFLVVTLGAGQPASGTLTEYVNLAPTLRITVRQAQHGYASARFAGLVNPSEVGGRVSLQRLVNGHWNLLMATNGQPAAGGSSAYAMTMHLRHSGYYRVFAAPIEDGHAPGYSLPVLVTMANAATSVFG